MRQTLLLLHLQAVELKFYLKTTLSLVFPKGLENLRTPNTTQKLTLHKKISFYLRISSIKLTADLVTFIEEILNGKLHFLSSVMSV